MKVAVYGASASAQTTHHGTDEVTGYSEVLRRDWLATLGVASLTQICYPGSRLSDGGLYRVGHVVGHEPDICLVEPLVEDTTRGQSVTPGEAEFVYRTLLRRRILPVAVLLPDPAKRTPRRWDSYELHQQICRDLGLPVIEIDLETMAEGWHDDDFNGLHTRRAGAELYAAEIARGLRALGDRDAIVDQAAAIGAQWRTRLHETSIATPERATVSTIELRVRPRTPGVGYSYRAVQAQQVGPFSPMISVDQRGAPSRGAHLRSVWDPYCHHERRGYPVLDERTVLPSDGASVVTIALSPLDPDYATSRRALASWPEVFERNLQPAGPIKIFSTTPVDVELLRFD